MPGRANRREAIGLLAAAAAFAPSLVRAQAAPSAPSADEVHEDTSVPTLDTPALQVTAPIFVDGQGPFQFLVDTGANISCIATALAEQLGLPPGPLVKVNTVAGSRRRQSVLVDRLQVGARTHRRVRAPVLPVTGLKADGVLGVDWLKGQRLVLGFAEDKLEITRSKADKPSEKSVIVPARRKSGQLTIVDADLSGERISAIVDSGSEVSLGNFALRELARRKDKTFKPGAPVGLISVAGERFEGEAGFLPWVRLGGLQMGAVPVVYADSHVFRLWELERSPALILGMDILRQFDAVALDFGRSNVRFDAIEMKT
ncbi:retroviral-like aspartic protease family protein [Phenylobacterium terrae]|uniref:Retroviral-like aspartic protease family protein n=1 Tax=Phenylobacterium terrae TaxID=2665495 RepID=A0ABW4N3F6_9CAUL